MADRNSKEWQERKNALRKNMKINPNPVVKNPEGEEENEELEEYEESLWEKLRRQPPFWVAVIFVLLILLVVIYRMFFSDVRVTETAEVWTVEMKENSYTNFILFGENVVKYDRDGAAYYGADGTPIWSQAYEMTYPVASKNGDYLVIFDQKGYKFYIFNLEGSTGNGSVTLPITKAVVSGKGVVAAILEDAAANYIRFFAPAGSALDIEIKTILSGDGYPLDISLSSDGTLLAASYVYLSAGAMQNKVVFYNFSDAGKNVVQRIVGGYEHYNDAIVADVEFLSQKEAVAFADDRLTFYSLHNEVSPEIAKEIEISGEIHSVFTGGGYVGVVTDAENAESSSQRKVTLYNGNGSVKSTFVTDMTYEDVLITGDFVVFTNGFECRIYTTDGDEKYSGALFGTIVKLINIDRQNWIQIGSQTMKRITLK